MDLKLKTFETQVYEAKHIENYVHLPKARHALSPKTICMCTKLMHS